MKWVAWLLQIVSAGFAMRAAWLWWKSTKPELPPKVTWMAAIGAGPGGGGVPIMGGGTAYPVVSADFDKMVEALTDQSKWNRRAAKAAATAAVIQGIADLIPPS